MKATAITSAVLAGLGLALGLAAPAAAVTAPQISMHLARTVVREPGNLTVTVTSSGCITDLQVYAHAAHGRDTAFSPPTPYGRDGRSFTVRLHFTTRDTAGTWYVDSAFAQPCRGPGVIYRLVHIPFRVIR